MTRGPHSLSSLSVVLPAFNEEGVIRQTVSGVVSYLRGLNTSFEVIVVNDGSSDDTASILTSLSQSYSELKVLTHKQNKGYGEALRSGFNKAQHEWILLMDSDGQFEISNLKQLLPYTKTNDLVLGTRSTRSDTFVRKVFTWGYNKLIQTLFGMTFDFGCGFKLFRREAWDRVQPIGSSDHKIFTIEWLLKSVEAHLRITQVPVNHYPRTAGEPTGARVDVMILTILQLVRLYLNRLFVLFTSLWPKSRWEKNLLTVLVAGLFLRFIQTEWGTHGSDLGLWISWGNTLQQQGLTVLGDRLPGGILYVLWLLAEAHQLLPSLSSAFIYKLPGNLADVTLAWIIFRLVARRSSDSMAFVAALFYFFNPFVWGVSALWGQMDAVQALLLIVAILFVHRGNVIVSAVVLAFVIQFKPHSLLIAPVMPLILWWHSRSNWRRFGASMAGYIVAMIVAGWVFALPFTDTATLASPFEATYQQWNVALDLYPYATLNAPNIWGALGLNWENDATQFAGITAKTWGALLVSIVVVHLCYIMVWRRTKPQLEDFFWVAAMLMAVGFAFLTRAHERHLFPFFGFITLALFLGPRLSLTSFFAYIGITAAATFGLFHAHSTLLPWEPSLPGTFKGWSFVLLIGTLLSLFADRALQWRLSSNLHKEFGWQRWQRVFRIFRSETASIISLIVFFKLALFGFSLVAFPFLSGESSAETVVTYMADMWNRWDSLNYIRVADDGYVSHGYWNHLIAFFPLYPALIYLTSWIVADLKVAALVVANIASLAGLYVFYGLARFEYGHKRALLTLIMLLAWPTAYFFNAGYTEGVFLLFAAGSLWAARSQHWLIASIAAALASVTRITGVALIPALIVEFILQWREGKHTVRPMPYLLLVAPLGFLGYLALNVHLFGSPFAFMDLLQGFWGKQFAWPWVSLHASWSKIDIFPYSNFGMVHGVWEFGSGLFIGIMAIASFRWMRLTYAVYIASVAWLLLSTLLLMSTPRYVLSAFPIFLLLGALSKYRRPYLMWIACSLLLLSLGTAHYVRGWWAY